MGRGVLPIRLVSSLPLFHGSLIRSRLMAQTDSPTPAGASPACNGVASWLQCRVVSDGVHRYELVPHETVYQAPSDVSSSNLPRASPACNGVASSLRSQVGMGPVRHGVLSHSLSSFSSTDRVISGWGGSRRPHAGARPRGDLERALALSWSERESTEAPSGSGALSSSRPSPRGA